MLNFRWITFHIDQQAEHQLLAELQYTSTIYGTPKKKLEDFKLLKRHCCLCFVAYYGLNVSIYIYIVIRHAQFHFNSKMVLNWWQNDARNRFQGNRKYNSISETIKKIVPFLFTSTCVCMCEFVFIYFLIPKFFILHFRTLIHTDQFCGTLCACLHFYDFASAHWAHIFNFQSHFLFRLCPQHNSLTQMT